MPQDNQYAIDHGLNINEAYRQDDRDQAEVRKAATPSTKGSTPSNRASHPVAGPGSSVKPSHSNTIPGTPASVPSDRAGKPVSK